MRIEVGCAIICNGTIEQQRVIIGHEKGSVRLMCQDLFGHVLALVVTNIRRVGHDDIKRRGRKCCLVERKHVMPLKIHLSLQMMCILSCREQGLATDIPG